MSSYLCSASALVIIFLVQVSTGKKSPGQAENLSFSCKEIVQSWKDVEENLAASVHPVLWGTHDRSFIVIIMLLDS